MEINEGICLDTVNQDVRRRLLYRQVFQRGQAAPTLSPRHGSAEGRRRGARGRPADAPQSEPLRHRRLMRHRDWSEDGVRDATPVVMAPATLSTRRCIPLLPAAEPLSPTQAALAMFRYQRESQARGVATGVLLNDSTTRETVDESTVVRGPAHSAAQQELLQQGEEGSDSQPPSARSYRSPVPTPRSQQLPELLPRPSPHNSSTTSNSHVPSGNQSTNNNSTTTNNNSVSNSRSARGSFGANASDATNLPHSNNQSVSTNSNSNSQQRRDPSPQPAERLVAASSTVVWRRMGPGFARQEGEAAERRSIYRITASEENCYKAPARLQTPQSQPQLHPVIVPPQASLHQPNYSLRNSATPPLYQPPPSRRPLPLQDSASDRASPYSPVSFSSPQQSWALRHSIAGLQPTQLSCENSFGSPLMGSPAASARLYGSHHHYLPGQPVYSPRSSVLEHYTAGTETFQQQQQQHCHSSAVLM